MNKEEIQKMLANDCVQLQFPIQTVEIGQFSIENDTDPRMAVIYGNLSPKDERKDTDADFYCYAYFVRVGEDFWVKNEFSEVLNLIVSLRELNDFDSDGKDEFK